jgi:GH24 family phage-related lysozyme (muramidase)
MVQQVSVINECTRLTDQEISTHVSAVQEQMDRDVGPLWNFQVKLNQIPKGAPRPNDQWWMVYLDNTDVATALGYHDLTPDGLPMGKVFVETTINDQQTVSRVLSYEVAELLVDPWMQRMVNVGGRQYLVEVGDPLSMDSQGYFINGILVSGIALPGYFYETDNKYDLHGLLPGPIPTAIHGTFLMWLENNQWVWQMAATDPDEEVNNRIKVFMRPRPGSRRYRRMIGRSQWVNSSVNVSNRAPTISYIPGTAPFVEGPSPAVDSSPLSQMNDAGFALLRNWEGCILFAYDDANDRRVNPGDRILGTLTIGYGHTGTDVFPGLMWSQEQAETALENDVSVVATQVRPLITAQLNNNQFSALVCFAYNIGLNAFAGSSVLHLVNQLQPSSVPTHMIAWDKATINGVLTVMRGLKNRREAEIAVEHSGLAHCRGSMKRRETISSNSPCRTFAIISHPDAGKPC